MEDTLREANGSGTFFYLKNGLNPCSNGRYSQSGWNIVDDLGVTS